MASKVNTNVNKMVSNLESLGKKYEQLLNMGFTDEEITKFLDGKKSPAKQLSQKEAIDIMVLYFRAKKLVEDPHVNAVIKNNEHLMGSSNIPTDVSALMAYQSFVQTMENRELLKNVGGKESIRTWENYFKEKQDDYNRKIRNSGKVGKKEIAAYEDIKNNPYDPRIRTFLEACLSDQTKVDIASALNMDPVALAAVRGLALETSKVEESAVDVVLRYLYADTTVSKLKSKNTQLENRNAELEKKVKDSATISSVEMAVLEAISDGTSTTIKAVANAREEIVGNVKVVGKKVDEANVKLENIQSTINKKASKKFVVATGAMGLALALSLGGMAFTHYQWGKTQDKLDAAYAENISLRNENQTLQSNSEALQNRIGELSGEITKLTGEVNDLNDKIKYSNPQEVAKLQEELKEKEALLETLKAEHETAINALKTDYDAKISELNNEIKGLNDIIASSKDPQEIERLTKEIERLEEEKAALEEGKAALEESNATLTEKNNAIMAELADALLQIETLAEAGILDKATIDELNVAIADLTTRNQELTALLEDANATANLTAEEIKTLKDDLAQTAEALGIAQARIAKLEEANAALTVVNGNLENELATILLQVESLTNAGIADRATIEELRAKVAELEALVNAGGNSEETETLRILLEEAQARIAELEEANAGLTTENAGLHAEIDELMTEIATLTENGVADRATIEALNATIAEKVALIEALQQAIAQNPTQENYDKIVVELNNYKNKLEEAQAQVAELEEANAGLTTENAGLATENAQLRDQVTDLQNSLEHATSIAEQLRAEIATLNTDKAGLAEQIANYTVQVEELNSIYNQQVAQYNQLLAQYNEAVSKSELDEARIAELESLITGYESTISEYENALDAIENELSVVVAENKANGKFLDELYYALQGSASGQLTDEQIRQIIADLLDVHYTENTQGSENDFPQRG